MKALSNLISVIGAFLCLTAITVWASPVSYDAVVTGKDDPAHDIQAVQRAVDQGGAVLLKGKFDFGDEGRINIRRNITICGEKDDQGRPITKIEGGFWTFHSPLPTLLPPETAGPKITIQDIHFDGALWAPICITYSSEATITGNKITNVKPRIPDLPVFGRRDVYRQQGIVLNPRYALPEEKQGGSQPGTVTGSILVSGNEIDLTCQEPEKTLAQGVMVFWTMGVDVQILRNRIVNCSRNSIESIDNSPGKDGSGMTLIKDNRIITATRGVPVPTPSGPNGIVFGWFLDLSGASDPAKRTRTIITNNHVEAWGDTSLGIGVLIDEAIITSNHIILGGGSQVRGIMQLTSDALIANNRIEGSGLCGISCGYKDFPGSRNILIGNDFSLLKASMADVLFEGSGNMIIGKCGKVVDKGQGNRTVE